MLKIYTPEEWHSVFGGCASLIIDDKGYIYKADEYYKILFGEPSGKIDYDKGCIYGEDYHKLSAAPIGSVEKKDGEIRIYNYPRGFSNPILYIKDDKIYTPKEYFSVFSVPGGYVRTEDTGRASTTDEFFGEKKAARKVPAVGEAGSGVLFVVGMCLFLLIGGAVEDMANSGRLFGFLAYFATLGVLGYHAKRLPKASDLHADEDFRKRCTSSALKVSLLGMIVPCLAWIPALGGGAGMVTLIMAAPMLLAAFAGMWIVTRKGMLAGRTKLYFDNAAPAAKEEPKAAEAPVAKEEPKAAEAPAAKEEPKAAEAPAAKEEPKAAEAPKPASVILVCPTCGKKCKVAAGQGKVSVTCPNAACKAKFTANT